MWSANPVSFVRSFVLSIVVSSRFVRSSATGVQRNAAVVVVVAAPTASFSSELFPSDAPTCFCIGHSGEAAHLVHERHLLDKVVEIELGLKHLFLHLLRLLVRHLRNGLFRQTDHVAHTQKARGHAVGIEGIKILELFAGTDELDGLAADALDGDGAPAAGVAVEFGEDGSGNADGVVEGRRKRGGLLTGHGVHDEERFGGVDYGVTWRIRVCVSGGVFSFTMT